MLQMPIISFDENKGAFNCWYTVVKHFKQSFDQGQTYYDNLFFGYSLAPYISQSQCKAYPCDTVVRKSLLSFRPDFLLVDLRDFFFQT